MQRLLKIADTMPGGELDFPVGAALNAFFYWDKTNDPWRRGVALPKVNFDTAEQAVGLMWRSITRRSCKRQCRGLGLVEVAD